MRRLAMVALSMACAGPAAAVEMTLPILVPLTGALALEGQSQRNGALLAAEEARHIQMRTIVLDTASQPTGAAQAYARIAGERGVFAVMGPIDGNSMLALLPLAAEAKIPLLTISGTAAVTEQNNPYVFRFFPSDAVVKAAQARYVTEELKRRRIALLYQSTAYGQSGRAQLQRLFMAAGAAPVHENAVTLGTKEMGPLVAQLRDAEADVVVLQLHSGSTALFVQQAARARLGLPIVAGSAMHQPSTAALLEPHELKDVCAETASAPAADDAPAIRAFAERYRARFKAEPDAFALAAYDAVAMTVHLRVRHASLAPDSLRGGFARERYQGLAMTYAADAHGNMAHDAMIVCYDGASRTPRIAKRYPRAAN